MTRRLRLTVAAAAVSACAPLGGCVVGPDYAGPPVVAPRAEAAGAFHRAPAAQASSAPALATWWTALNDPELDRLETLALDASPTLDEAEARLRKAAATLGERRAALLPTGGANALALRAKLPSTPLSSSGGGGAGGQSAGGSAASSPGAASGGGSSSSSSSIPPFTLYAAGIDATWQIDLFGGTRRRIQAARADRDYEEAEFEDAQVTLTADVAKAYVNLRDAQHRAALSRDNTQVQQRMLDLTRQRRAMGTVGDDAVDRQITQLKQTQADAVPLLAQIEVYTDQLSQLTGREPGLLDEELKAAPRPAPPPAPPAHTDVSDPASLIRRRPDVRAAERQMASDSAMIGYQVSQYFPSLTLLGTVDTATTKAGQLFSGGSLTYIAGPSLSWNFLSFPATTAQVREARAQYDARVAAYRGKVLSALLDAENSLSRFGHQRDNVQSLDEAAAAAAHASVKARERFAGGTLSLIDSLDVERQRIETQTSLAQGRAQLTTYWISLQSSLGLGWREDRKASLTADQGGHRIDAHGLEGG